jgi:hypothetical protein
LLEGCKLTRLELDKCEREKCKDIETKRQRERQTDDDRETERSELDFEKQTIKEQFRKKTKLSKMLA